MKVADDEPIFVLRAQDALAPATVRRWCELARGAGVSGRKILEAAQLADRMEAWAAKQGSKTPD